MTSGRKDVIVRWGQACGVNFICSLFLPISGNIFGEESGVIVAFLKADKDWLVKKFLVLRHNVHLVGPDENRGCWCCRNQRKWWS